MEELLDYRQRMLDKLVGVSGRVEQVIVEMDNFFQPFEGGTWSLHQILAHMRDVNLQVYLPRLHRILDEDKPVFENFDGEAWMAKYYQREESMEKISRELGDGCTLTATWLRNLPNHAWNRPGKHPTLGEHSLQWWVEQTLSHLEEHLVKIGSKGE
jgi:hypothetical protein